MLRFLCQAHRRQASVALMFIMEAPVVKGVSRLSSFGIRSSISLWLATLWNIILANMKSVYIALILGCMGGFLTLLIKGVDEYKTSNTAMAIIYWVVTLAVVVLGIITFCLASRIGRKEDEIAKAEKGGIINAIEQAKRSIEQAKKRDKS